MSEIRIYPQRVAPTFPAPVQKPQKSAEEGGSFGDMLSKAIGNVNELQHQAGEAQEKLIKGEAAELHQVMIAAEKAGISFDLLLEVRRRLIEAYQEIMRMPV
jgi:flagellar hook-basal body complex protein FliE